MMEFRVKHIWGDTTVLKDGVVCEATEADIEFLMDLIRVKMPINHTYFKNYNPDKEVWTIEIYSESRDFNTKPVWRGTFRKITERDIVERLKTLHKQGRPYSDLKRRME